MVKKELTELWREKLKGKRSVLKAIVEGEILDVDTGMPFSPAKEGFYQGMGRMPLYEEFLNRAVDLDISLSLCGWESADEQTDFMFESTSFTSGSYRKDLRCAKIILELLEERDV